MQKIERVVEMAEIIFIGVSCAATGWDTYSDKRVLMTVWQHCDGEAQSTLKTTWSRAVKKDRSYSAGWELEYSRGSKVDLRMRLPYVSTDVTRGDVDDNDDDDDEENLMKI